MEEVVDIVVELVDTVVEVGLLPDYRYMPRHVAVEVAPRPVVEALAADMEAVVVEQAENNPVFEHWMADTAHPREPT